MKKRIISFFTALSMTLMLFTSMPIIVSAVTIVANGTCGAKDNTTGVEWMLDSDGVFTISGTGRMRSWTSYGVYPPWQMYGGSIKTIKIIGIENIGDYAFDLYGDSITSVSIPDSVTEIGKEVFGDCVSLTEINIPDSVTKIGINAFEGCTSLETIVIPKNVTVIERGVFNNCTSLNSVKIPSGVTRIEEYVFEGCTSLTEIDIPDTVTEIEPCAFAGSGFTSIPKLPSVITSISEGMFQQCQNLTSVRIPDNITSIGEIAFSFCPNLTSVIIPNSVDSIGAMAFIGCENLEYVLYPANAELGENAFAGYDGNDLTDSTINQLKYETGGDKRRIIEIVLGSGKTDVTVTDEMNVNFVNENERSKVSQEGHTHVAVNNICQICNAAVSSHTHKACADSNHADCAHSEIEYEQFSTDGSGEIIIKNDKNYYLTADLTDDTLINKNIYVENATVNLCLNGHTIITKGFKIYNNGVLNICDCKTGGCIQNYTQNTAYTSGVLNAHTNGTLNVYSGKICAQKGMTIHSGDPSVTNIYGGEISGGCIMVGNGSALSIYGGTVINNTEESCDGINVLNDALVNINGGTIAGSEYGIIANYSGSTVNINGGSVEGRDNSALYIQNGVICNITGGAVASTDHSAVYTLDGGVANIKGGNLTSTSFPTVWIDNNGIANISGGNISNQGYSSYIWNNGTMNISGGVFTADRDKIGYIRNFNNFSLRGNSTLINTGIWLDSNDDSEKNITINGALTNTEAYPIYITGSLPRTFTSGWDTHMSDKNTSKYFKSPYNNSKIVYRDNEAVMVYYYKITYDANGGSCTIGSAEADASDKLTSLATPTREGYSFVGWFTEETGGEQVTKDTVFTNDTTIYAHWTCNDHIWGDTYEKDEDGHWQICTRCNAESEKTGHTWDEGEETTPPTETTEGVMLYTCTVCKATKTEPKAPLDHTHDWSDEWSKDDTYHWHDCLKNCGEKKDNAAHIWDDGTVTNQPTAEDEGEKTYECTVCGKTKTETLPPKDEPSEPDSGNISVDVQPGENAPNTELKTPFDELADAVLTPEEQENIKNGIDIKIILSVSNATESVPTDDKAKIEAAIRGLSDYKLGQYLDLNLLKIIGNSEGVRITQTNKPITVTFEIPAALRGKAEYSVIRVHNGTATVLRDLDSAPDTVTIETDKFSTYAPAYKEKTTTSNPSGGNSSGGNPGGSSNPPTSTPGEGDNSDAASSDDGKTTSSESDTSSNVSNHSPSESSPSEDNGNPSTGIAVSLIPLVTAAAILTVAVKLKKK